MLEGGVMKFIVTLAMVAILFPSVVAAQILDPQIRILFHNHLADPGKRVGVASWTILPDITDKNPKGRNLKRLLFVAGPLLKSQGTGNDYNWFEVMGGALFEVNPNTKMGKLHPLVNVRAYLRGKKADLYLENQIRQDRLLFSAFVTTPLTLKKIGLRLGGEFETIVATDAKASSVFKLGPRISVKLSYSWLALATVLFVDQDRQLISLTYIKLGK